MKRFIIIDPSLCSLQGHHYECSVSVAEAATKLGYESIIITNRSFSADLHPVQLKILPRFEVDWFDNPTLIDKANSWQQKIKQNLSYLQNNSFDSFIKKQTNRLEYQINYWHLTQPKFRLLLEKIQGSLTRLGQWVQKDIKLLTYIPFSNTFWGLFKIIWGTIRYLGQIIFSKSIKYLDKLINSRHETFKDTFNKLFEELSLTSEDQILIHTLGIRQVEDIYHLLIARQNQSIPQFHLLLRRDPDEPLVTQAKGMGLTNCLNAFADSQLWINKVKFYTDTPELLQKYNCLSPVKLIKVPVPFRTEKLSLPITSKLGEPIHIVYLGDARYEKGYHHLPQLVESLWDEYLSQNKIKFTIQSNFSTEGGESGILSIRLQLEQYPSSKVRLIKEVMKTEEYYKILSNADIVILPYDQVNYRYRTSGVLTEALAAGKPVIVPNDTWLSRQIDESRGKVYNHPSEMGHKIREMITNLAHFKAAAEDFRLDWLQQNTPETFLNCLLSEQDCQVTAENLEIQSISVKPNEFSAQQTNPKILCIIESEDFVNETSQKQKILQYWTYLFNCGYQVSLLTFSKYPSYKQGNYEAFYYQVHNVTDHFRFNNVWILEHDLCPRLPNGIDYKSYLQNLQTNQQSVVQDLVNCNSVKIEDNLIQVFTQSDFDLIYLNSSVTVPLVKQLGIHSVNILCEIEHLLSYQYAVNNRKDINILELELEKELLNQYSYIITPNAIQAEKLREILISPQIKLLSGLEDRYTSEINQLFKEILGAKALPLNKSKNIAILYPWGDILEGKSGASKRVGLLTQYLKDQDYNLWVFTTGEKQDFYRHGIRYSYYQQQFSQSDLVNDIYKDAYQTWQTALFLDDFGGITNSVEQEHWLPWIYYQFRFDKSFKKEVEKVADWANIIILEYPFWASIVGEICHRQSVKLILNAHDVLTQQLPQNSTLRQLALAEEIQGLKQADKLVCVCPEDQAFFQQYGLQSTVIPNPVDIEDFQNEKNGSINDRIAHKLKDQFCLFVGSQHSPNLEAVAQIRQMATLDPSIQYVIVGSCCQPEENQNFLSFGKVSGKDLVYLYGKASLIISPLLSGTGSSLKIIEAMAYRKVVLGTQISFRGYSVLSQVHCIIEDNLTLYPQQIHHALLQPDQLKNIAKKAQEFAKKYDYRIAYESYQNIIKQLS